LITDAPGIGRGVGQKISQDLKAHTILPFKYVAGLSNDIIAGIAGDPCSAGTPEYNMTLSIDGEDAVGHHIQHVAQNGRIFSEISFHYGES